MDGAASATASASPSASTSTSYPHGTTLHHHNSNHHHHHHHHHYNHQSHNHSRSRGYSNSTAGSHRSAPTGPLPPLPASSPISIPPIPRQTRQSSRQKSLSQHHQQHQQPNEAGRAVASAHSGSPEVISSLITSLSVNSNQKQPGSGDGGGSSSSRRQAYPLSLAHSNFPEDGGGGSFGVDYGAFSRTKDRLDAEQNIPLDERAAASPTVRTAKPPSGLSALTAPISPRSLHRDSSSGGIKSLLRSSRPSSRGSAVSQEDARSIGNLSIERGEPPVSSDNLHKQRSHDSWGKKSARNTKGLMYMSSRERLRASEDRKRTSIGSIGGNSIVVGGGGVGNGGGGGGGSSGIGGSSSAVGRQQDSSYFLAGTSISEEPNRGKPAADSTKLGDQDISNTNATGSSSNGEHGHGIGNGNGDKQQHQQHQQQASSSRSASFDFSSMQRRIPERDSSLRKTSTSTSTNSKRRSTRSTRQSDGGLSDAIPEYSEQQDAARGGGDYSSESRSADARQRSYRSSSSSKKADSSYYRPALRGERASAPGSRCTSNKMMVEEDEERASSDPEDGAPFPSIYSSRRKSLTIDDRRKPTRVASDYIDDGKRNSSKLKRLSTGGGRSDQDRDELLRSPTPEPHITYERPPSADSIDGAVETYLKSTRLTQKIRHPQTGRVISFSEVGDPDGCAVFCCVGMGLTRYVTAFYDELALTLKLRLITPDRPGVGDSEPYADGSTTPLTWPDDVYAVCQALKINKFSILAHSAGAIYALATALRMPQHIRGRIHLLAPWIPPSQMNVFGTSQALPPTNAIPTSQRILRALPTPFLRAANSSFMTATSSSLSTSLPKDRKKNKRKSTAPGRRDITPASLNLEKLNSRTTQQQDSLDPTDGKMSPPPNNMEHIRKLGADLDPSQAAILDAAMDSIADKERQMTYDTRLTHAIWELATRGANPAVDLLVCLERRHSIGFRYVDITRPVVIHHGSRDNRVPVDNVRWLGKTMRKCEVRVLEGEGHGLMASASVMGSVLMEISKEWEDWMRVTGSGTQRERSRSFRGTGK